MMNKCLYCYKPLDEGLDFHSQCSKSFFGSRIPPGIPYSIDQMAELAQKVVEQRISVPGVQVKLSMTLIKKTRGTANTRLTVVGALGGNFIFKPPSSEYPEMPQNEHVTMRIAESFNIPVVPSSLIRLESGELSYITRRVDRTEKGRKIHMLDMFQITEAFEKYKSSMEKVGKALHTYSENTLLDKIIYYELSLFSFLTGNNDMHLKNFSMIEGSSGWILAPAYDLLNVSILLPQDNEELALTMEGKKRKLSRQDFVNFGKGMDLTDKQIASVFNRALKNKVRAIKWIDNSFLSGEMKTAYKDTLESKYKQLNL